MANVVKLARFVKSSAECAAQPSSGQGSKSASASSSGDLSLTRRQPGIRTSLPLSCFTSAGFPGWFRHFRQARRGVFPGNSLWNYHVCRVSLENIPKARCGCCCSMAPCAYPQVFPGSLFPPAAPFPLALCRLSQGFSGTSSTPGSSEVQVYM